MLRPADNPFAAHRIDAIPYELRGTSWDDLFACFEALGRRAAIVGPHGTGKTTLIEALGGRLEAKGWDVRAQRLRTDDRSLPASFTTNLGPTTILMLDSAGCLGPGALRGLIRRSTAAGGLLVTAHRSGLLPTLLRTHVDASIMSRLVEHLMGGPSPWPHAELQNMLRAHQGNARLVLRALYDRCARLSLATI